MVVNMLKIKKSYDIIYHGVMFNMYNPNVLISMAYVSENENNPYFIFCEYIKYCMSINANEKMTIFEIKDSVNNKFGLTMPNNVLLACMKILINENSVIGNKQSQFFSFCGQYDTNDFDKRCNYFKEIEEDVVNDLISYAANFNLKWDYDYAREQLIDALVNKELAYDVFFQNYDSPTCDEYKNLNETEKIFPDKMYAGKYILKTISDNTLHADYLKKICEGLMICIGAYQSPGDSSKPNVNGTTFFFDTRLLLRYLGCGGKAAVEAVRELVNMIQRSGGKICYYQHTFEEMKDAFKKAEYYLKHGTAPYDTEMRIYCASVNNNLDVITAKKATIVKELEKDNIFMRELSQYDESERLKKGFDKNHFSKFILNETPWELQTIDNDVDSIWETHMLRNANYTEYYGTKQKLCVFVTSNLRLVDLTVKFRENNTNIKSINQWEHNRLPIITDVRLTCRLWSPSSQGQKLSFLHLTANAFAAQQPTQKYYNRIRELAIQLSEQTPAYATLKLTEYFDDRITEKMISRTKSSEDIDLGTLAASIDELFEIKKEEYEKDKSDILNKLANTQDKLNQTNSELNKQNEVIVYDAVQRYKEKLIPYKILLLFLLHWTAIIDITFTFASVGLTYLFRKDDIMSIVVIPIIVFLSVHILSVKYLKRKLLKIAIDKIERKYEGNINHNLTTLEKRYSNEIVIKCKKENTLLNKCKQNLYSNNS